MRLSQKIFTGSSLLLATVALLAVNIFASAVFTSTRLDLTESQLYTLTDGTRRVLDNLDEPVTLRLFLSQQLAVSLPGISSYAQRVRELLQEYERIAGANIRLRVIDPEPFSEQEDRAVAYGLRGVSLDQGDAVFYFGLVGTNAVDDQEAIPFFSPNREQFLEHDITKLIYQLSNPSQRVVGLMSGLPMDGGMAFPGRAMQPSWVILEQIRQLFEVRTVATDVAKIPDEVDVLMIVHPKGWSERTVYAIDQFILRGGRALIFVDPHSESDQPTQSPMMARGPGTSNLPTLFQPWGLELVAGKVAGDVSVAEQVRYADDRRSAVAKYPIWMNMQPAQFDPDDIVTAELGNLLFASSGILQIKSVDGVTVTPLVTTTAKAMQMDSAQLLMLTDPSVLLRQYRPGDTPLVLAVRVSGRVKTAFAGGQPPALDDDAQKPEGAGDTAAEEDPMPHVAEAGDDINVIVVADTDMLSDRFWVQVQNLLGTRISIPTASNGAFVINALESLTGNNDLISVRSRGRYARPFTKVADIQQEAELRFRQKEQELLNRLRETEVKLIELEERKPGDSAVILSSEQRQEIETFRREKVRIRKELRLVRHQLHKNIEQLESWTKFVNIGFMPLLIGVGGVLVGVQRMRRRRSGHTTG